MTNERAVEILNLDLDILGQYRGESAEAYKMAIKALEQQPCEDCVSRSELQKTMDSLPLFRFVNNDHEEADDYYNCESVDMVIRNLPSVTPRTNLAETSQDCISREEMLKYQQYLHGKMSNEENHKLWNFIKGLPSVTPKYTDEEIDKAQAVEQAYVDNMVELAVEEIREEIIADERYHICGRCRWGDLPDEFYPCNKCIHSADKREDYWQYAESEDEKLLNGLSANIYAEQK